MPQITIQIKATGPLIISPEDAPHVRILDPEGVELQTTPGKPIKLCRCGHSLKRPFCDGKHNTCGLDLSIVPPDAAAPQVPPAP
jgi:CDGSH-type Zn-finger protein